MEEAKQQQKRSEKEVKSIDMCISNFIWSLF